LQGSLTLIYFKYCQLPNFAAATIFTNKFSTSPTKIPSVALTAVVAQLSKLYPSSLHLREHEETTSDGNTSHSPDFLALSLRCRITKSCLVIKSY